MKTSSGRILFLLNRSVVVATTAALIPLLAPGGNSTARAAGQDPTSDIPADLRVDGPRVGIVHTTGFQVYTCAADATGKLAWTLKGPDAKFENASGLKGRHYGTPSGPAWEAADGSKVIGRKLKEHASSAADTIPWLLLEAKDHAGKGQLSSVTYIQRIHTVGGKAPALSGAKAGDEIRVAYRADYIFYGPGANPAGAKP